MKYKGLDEYLRYGYVPAGMEEILQKEADSKVKLEKEVRSLRRSEELAWEQVGFARDLIETLQNQLQSAKSGKHARKIFQSCLGNSYFEL